MKLKNLSFAISTATIMAFGSLFSPAYSAGKDITIVIAEEPDIVDPCEATRSVVGKIVKQNGSIFHVDAAQSAGKIPIDIENLEVDLMSFSAHKIYGPKGIGLLLIDQEGFWKY